MFDTATRKKLRFATQQGYINVEDLWDLPLTSRNGKTNLDDIALALNQELKGSSEVVSFVDEGARQDPIMQLRFDIVKHIIDVRKKENAEALAAKDKARVKEQLLAVLERKQASNLETMSEEELRKRIAEL